LVCIKRSFPVFAAIVLLVCGRRQAYYAICKRLASQAKIPGRDDTYVADLRDYGASA